MAFKFFFKSILSQLGYEVHKTRKKAASKSNFELSRDGSKNNISFLKDDVFLVSYPKSGNTWVRNIIAYLLYPEERLNKITSLQEIDELIPDLSRNSGERILQREDLSSPRVMKLHSSYPFRPGDKSQNSCKRVIYIVRHPFDVVLSYQYYFGTLYHNGNLRLEDAIEKVIFRGNSWGTWQDNVLSWKALESTSDMLFIRYEDLKQNTTELIIKIGEFLLHKEISLEQAEDIKSKCSISAMAKLKTRRAQKKNEDFQFVRTNDQKQNQKQVLTDEMKKVILEQCGYTMQLFNYSVDL